MKNQPTFQINSNSAAVKVSHRRLNASNPDSQQGLMKLFAGLAAIVTLQMWHSYYVEGFNPWVGVEWLVSLGLTAVVFGLYEGSLQPFPAFRKTDFGCAALLMLILSPFYLMSLHTIPVQVCTDEIVCMLVDHEQIMRIHPDVFGVTNYFAFPAGSFFLIGALSKLLGGVGLHNVRLVNGLFGLGVVMTGYFLFRLAWPQRLSFLAAILLGTNQALIGISRMALLHSLAIFTEMVAFIALYYGFASESSLVLMIGGALAGLGAYVYYSSRIVLLVWFIFMIFALRRNRSLSNGRTLMRLALPTVVGFILSTAPMGLSSLKSQQILPDYAKHQLVLFSEGRDLARSWEGTSNTLLALLRNTWHGLGAFNNNMSDHGNIYINPGHGFIDPLSGILLWVGVGTFLFSKRKSAFDRFAATGFFSIWLFLSILTTKNPEFERMLALLPFAIYFIFCGARYLSSIGIWIIAQRFHAVPMKRLLKMRNMLLTLLTLSVAVWNLEIYHDQYHWALTYGDPVGYLVRYVESRKTLGAYHYYFAMDAGRGYFWFGDTAWQLWVKFFTGDEQNVEILSPASLVAGSSLASLQRPFTLMMNAAVWTDCQNSILRAFPEVRVHFMTPQHSHVAVELL